MVYFAEVDNKKAPMSSTTKLLSLSKPLSSVSPMQWNVELSFQSRGLYVCPVTKMISEKDISIQQMLHIN